MNNSRLKTWKFQIHKLSSFSSIKEIVTRKKRTRSKLVLFLSLFLSVHMDFQNKLNYRISLFIVTVSFFYSIAILIFFFICNFTVFFLEFFFINLMDMNKWVLPLVVISFTFDFNSRKTKQALIVFYL